MKNKKTSHKITFLIFNLLALVGIFSFVTLINASQTQSGKISINSEQDYRVGEIVTIYASLTNKTGEVTNASTYCNLTIKHWNGTALEIDLNNVAMNSTGQTGWYYYNWQIPENAQTGSYGVLVIADPNGIDTQATSGFHVAKWAKEIEYLWQKYQRTNTSIIHNESIVSATLSSTLNITIWYNVTIPLKEGFNTSDYLPMRWKFWFVDLDTNSCIDQSREQRFIEPYCNPLTAQVIGLGNATLEVNITIRPSLKIGNYTIVREIEVDPEQIWISYGHGPIGSIEVLEDNEKSLIDATVKEDTEKITKTTTTIPLSFEEGGNCIQILMPLSTTTLEIEKQKAKIIGKQIRKKESTKGLFLDWLSYILLGLIFITFYFTYTYTKNKENKEKEFDRW